VGSSPADLVGHRLMLDVLSQMQEQPDHWVLVSSIARRTRLDTAQLEAGIVVVAMRGWLEVDCTFRDQRRVRLTAEGRALFASSERRMRPVERRAPRWIRRRLPSHPI
jgi:DNA-binding MarR family transcriptional regulator